MPSVSLQPETIAQDLRDYGEADLAELALGITETQRISIGWAAGRYWDTIEDGRNTGIQLRKAVALGAVEVLEGRPRDLKRKRARTRAR